MANEIGRSYWLGKFSDLAGDNHAPGLHAVENEVDVRGVALAVHWAINRLNGVYPLQLSAAQLGLFDIECCVIAHRYFRSMFIHAE